MIITIPLVIMVLLLQKTDRGRADRRRRQGVSRRRLTGAARLVERRRENVEMLMGVLGFFIAVLLVATGIAEIKGEDSLARALVLAILVGLFYVLVRVRRTLQHQLAALVGDTDETRRSPLMLAAALAGKHDATKEMCA